MVSILIGDGDPLIRGQLATYVRDLGHGVATAAAASEVLTALAAQAFDVILADDRLPDMGGTVLLNEIRQRRPEAVVVLMSGHASIPDAVTAMRARADDYVAKPLTPEHIQALLQCVTETQAERARRDLAVTSDSPPLLESANPQMARALTTARRVAASEATVLLSGESGTGKNVLAAAIHEWGGRPAGNLIVVSCPVLVDHRADSDPFGRLVDALIRSSPANGNHCGESASRTLFLDEVDELPLTLQAELLRFLKEHRLERVAGGKRRGTRIIVTTTRDLEAEVRERRFRNDLFFRLNIVDIHLPPLRERHEDLGALTDLMVTTFSERHGRSGIQLGPEANEALAAYEWPGNVRELANVIERATVLARAETIYTDDLPDRLRIPGVAPVESALGTSLSLEQLERRHIEGVLAHTATLEEAATRLGINATTLWRKRKRYRIC